MIRDFSSQRREMLLFLTTNMAAMTSRANQQPGSKKTSWNIHSPWHGSNPDPISCERRNSGSNLQNRRYLSALGELGQARSEQERETRATGERLACLAVVARFVLQTQISPLQSPGKNHSDNLVIIAGSYEKLKLLKSRHLRWERQLADRCGKTTEWINKWMNK